MDALSLLTFDSLACLRGGRLVFEQLSDTVSAGDTLIINGPNGSGKSSLLRLLAGLGAPADGSITRAAAHAYMGHDVALKPTPRLSDELAFWGRLSGNANRLPAAIAAMQLEPLLDRPCRMLSSGQKRRAALARVIASGAPLWLLDEPSVGLDHASIILLTKALAAHLGGGGGAIIASHIPLDLTPCRTLLLA